MSAAATKRWLLCVGLCLLRKRFPFHKTVYRHIIILCLSDAWIPHKRTDKLPKIMDFWFICAIQFMRECEMATALCLQHIKILLPNICNMRVCVCVVCVANPSMVTHHLLIFLSSVCVQPSIVYLCFSPFMVLPYVNRLLYIYIRFNMFSYYSVENN